MDQLILVTPNSIAGSTPAGGAVASSAGAPLAPTASSVSSPGLLLPVTRTGSNNAPAWPMVASAMILLGAGIAGYRQVRGKKG